MILASTSHNTPESATPGSGRGEVIGGGAPLRYGFTSRGFAFLQSWNDASCAYSIMQLYMGSNFMANLEVVSSLNCLNISNYMYHYNTIYRTERYYPKLYLGTSQTIAAGWNGDTQSGINHPSIWPEVKPQKGEANKKVKHQFTSLFTLY